MWPQASGAPQICNRPMFRRPLQHHAQYSTYVIYPEIDQLGKRNVAYKLTSSRIRRYLKSRTPTQSALNNSNLRSLIHFKNDRERGFMDAV
jgi:hypothetical protein